MTYRPEAGQRPPLRPIELTSSTTAPLSRERHASHLAPFRVTEELRTGTEGLFARVRSELADQKFYVPQTTLPQDPEQPITVVIASSNQRKIDGMLEHVTNHKLNVFRVEEAAHAELHTKMAEVDAASKALKAEEIIQTSEDNARREIRIRPHVIIANDSLNAIPVVVEDEKTGLSFVEFHRLGKPKSDTPENPVESIRDTFAYLSEMAERHDWKSVPYITELATVIRNPIDDTMAVSVQKSAIFLSRESLKHLATDRFEEYVSAVNTLVAKESKPTDITHIAGGLEFQILDQMGVVAFVSGTADDIKANGFPPEQRPNAKEHAYRIALAQPDEPFLLAYFGGKQQQSINEVS